MMRTETSFNLHKAGGVYSDLVIEPLGMKRYLWKKGDKKGIADSVYDKENDWWYLEIDDVTYFFEGKPLDKLVFRIPDENKIQQWISGELSSKTSQEVYEEISKAIRIFLDLPFKHNYDIAALLVLESWATEKLNVVFYGGIAGGFGGGKTVSLEVVKALSKHGCLSGSITAAGSSRLIEEQKLTVFYDELDVKDNSEDNQLYMSIRQGYRRNNWYIRLKAKTFEPETFDSFGVKVFSLHSDIERATKSRAFTINIGETSDKRLSIINLKKEENMLNNIHDDIFFWYMENIANAYIDVEPMPVLDMAASIEEIRSTLHKNAVSLLSGKELEFLNAFRGRNVELGYIALQICNIFGIDVLDSLIESFKEKEELENEYDENSILSILKETLIEYLDRECVMQQVVFSSFNDKLALLNLKAISPHKFKAYLREFGFIDGMNRKKKKVEGVLGSKAVYHLFFDERARSKLVSQVSQVSQVFQFPYKEQGATESGNLLYYWKNQETQETPETQETVNK